MKKFVFLFVLVLFAVSAYSQTYIETKYREYCYYNEYSEKYDDCEGYEDFTTFKISKDWSYWTHITPQMTSTYYVDDSYYDGNIDFKIYEVTSDANNKYKYVFDFDNLEVRILGKTKEGKSFLLRFYVKDWWEN